MSGLLTRSNNRTTRTGTFRCLLDAVVPSRRILRRALFFGAVALTMALGADMMFEILVPNGLTVIESAILILFTVTFGWIAMSFWTAVAGFVLRVAGLDPISLRRRRCSRAQLHTAITTRTAIVMPICDEEPVRVLAGLEASWRSLQETGAGRHFDFYLLSDTTDPGIAATEETGWRTLCHRLGTGSRIFYRRRERRTGRKAGNIADFCCRWGRLYDHLIVLDADSVMAGQTVLALVRAMQADPRAGIIQTPPVPVRQETFFGRFVQFASELYGPMLSTGLSFWQLGEANYWGHNAIIRIAPFMKHCGLPRLPGDPPFGGEILSHDFVEAALMRRAGWEVFLLDDLPGSYEEVPSNIVDYARRDRRWAQGNLQHLRLVRMRGLHAVSRFNFVLGALAYGSSLIWLLLLGLGSADALTRALVPHEFFRAGYQLFPDWPIIEEAKIFSLLTITAVMLVLPKAGGVLICLFNRERLAAFGGMIRLIGSAVVELLFSMLLAPLMMTMHAYFVLAIIAGSAVSWGRQSRDGRSLTLRESMRYGSVPTLLGAVWGAVTYVFAPSFFWWLSPVIASLALSIPLLWISSCLELGRRVRRLGLFLTPEECTGNTTLDLVDRALTELPRAMEAKPRKTVSPIQAPTEVGADMQAQPFDIWSPLDAIRERHASDRLSWS